MAKTENTSGALNSVQREAIRHISSANSANAAEDHVAPFLMAASQINIDFASAAELEYTDKINIEDPVWGIYDMFRSPMYWKLRDSFLEEADKGSEYAFLTAIWRAYNAGRACPNRLSNEKSPSPEGGKG